MRSQRSPRILRPRRLGRDGNGPGFGTFCPTVTGSTPARLRPPEPRGWHTSRIAETREAGGDEAPTLQEGGTGT